MRKWPLLIVALLLVSFLAGDVFLLHHHLGGFSLDAEHTLPQVVSSDILYCLPCAHEGVSVWAPESCFVDNGGDSATQQFCGWHSSAYLEGPDSRYNLWTQDLPCKSRVFDFLKGLS